MRAAGLADGGSKYCAPAGARFDPAQMIDIDGAYGEGGGQLVRTAAALAAITGTPLRLSNVRARRGRPGLAPQHLAAVRAVAGLCEARCEGLALRASSFTLEPRARPLGGELRVDVGTAGSVTLVLQALLPILLHARRASRVVVTGGDHPRGRRGATAHPATPPRGRWRP